MAFSLKTLFRRAAPALRTRDSFAWPWSPIRPPGAAWPFEAATMGSRAPPGWYGLTTFLQRPYLYTRIIAQRARYAQINDTWCHNGAAELVSGMVGAGMSAEPAIDDAETRAAIVKQFRQW